MADGEELKAVIVGGSSVPVLTAAEVMACNLDYESLAAAGTMLGSGGMIVIPQRCDMVELIQVLMHFYWDESCGQCTPCREGTGWLHRIVRRLRAGEGAARRPRTAGEGVQRDDGADHLPAVGRRGDADAQFPGEVPGRVRRPRGSAGGVRSAVALGADHQRSDRVSAPWRG